MNKILSPVLFKGRIDIAEKDKPVIEKSGENLKKALAKANQELSQKQDDKVTLLHSDINFCDVLRLSPKDDPDKNAVVALQDKLENKERTSDEIADNLLNAYSELENGDSGKFKPGDVVAFSPDKKFLSKVIRFVTNSSVSHVGIMIDEKTMMDAIKFGLVRKSDIRTLLKEKTVDTKEPERIYLLELTPEERQKILDHKEDFDKYVKESIGKPFDYKTFYSLGVKSLLNKMGLKSLSDKMHWKEDTSRVICSEEVSDGFKKVHILPEDTNISMLAPKDVVNMDIYKNKKRIN